MGAAVLINCPYVSQRNASVLNPVLLLGYIAVVGISSIFGFFVVSRVDWSFAGIGSYVANMIVFPCRSSTFSGTTACELICFPHSHGFSRKGEH